MKFGADAPILPTLSVGAYSAVGTQATQAARTMSAAYWFQSPEQTTDDYGTRIWADLAVQRQRWVLVSILFDETPEPNAPEVQALVLSLHQAVAQALGAPLQAASK